MMKRRLTNSINANNPWQFCFNPWQCKCQMSWTSHSLTWECFEECLILTCLRLSLATVPLMSSIAELILKQIEAKSSGPQEGCVVGRVAQPTVHAYTCMVSFWWSMGLENFNLMISWLPRQSVKARRLRTVLGLLRPAPFETSAMAGSMQ